MRASIPALRFVSVVALALAYPPLLAQAQPTGRGAGAVNRLIVRAVNSAGQPVTDLKAEELTIKVDGRDRKVTGLELVTAASAPAAPPAAAAPSAAAPAAAPSTLPEPFATNAAASPPPAAAAPGAREFLILIDEEGIGAGREEPVRKAVAQLMSQASPSDRFGLVSLRLGGVQIAPTTDRKPVTDAMAKFVGGGSARETGGEMICRTKRALGTFHGTLRSSMTGRTIVAISPGLPASPEGMAKIGRADTFSTTDLCQIRSSELEELGVSANTSPANMYFVYYSEGLASSANMAMAQQGLENLAGVTNAEFVRLSGGNDAGIIRIGTETSSYYIARLDEAPAGPGRRIEGRASRDGVKVIARPAIDRPGPGVGSESAKGVSPRDMMKTTAPFTQVPLRAAGYVSRQGTAEMKVITLFEPVDPAVKLTAASVGVIDEKGSAKQWTAKPEELTGSPIAAAQLITPGKYRVRVAAVTANGEGGTVDYDLTAAIEDAGTLKLATMMLGFTNDKGGFTPKLQFTSNDKMVVGMVEIYGVTKGANVTVQYELAQGEATAPLGDAPGQIIAGPGEDARVAVGGFGIETLAPGDYVMRAKISVDGKHAGTASRTVRKVK